MNYPPPFQSLKVLSEHICMGEETIERKVREGKFPQPCYRDGKRLWRWKDVEKFLAPPKDAEAPSAADPEKIREATRHALQSR